MEGVPWFVFPLILLTIGLIGLVLTIRSFKNGGSISLKKVIALVMLLCLGAGIFMQKAGIVDNSQLKNLQLAFDYEARKEAELQKKQELEAQLNAVKDRVNKPTSRVNKAVEKAKEHNEKLKRDREK